jgi:ribosomal-protein-alanine N-acetyltransferase
VSVKAHQSVIETQRLILRPLTDGDCTAVYLGWLADSDINRFLETRHSVQTLDSIRDFVETTNANPAEFLYGIFVKANGVRHIGNIKVGPIRARHPLADMSLFIGARDCWGQGYATEAIAALSRHAFDALGVHKLSASMYAENVGSMKAFLAAGYRQEGLRRSHYSLEDRMSDLVELGALREDLTLPQR